MSNKIKPVRCDNCKFFTRDTIYHTDGLCNNNGAFTRENYVCSLLPTDEDRLKAMINKPLE